MALPDGRNGRVDDYISADEEDEDQPRSADEEDEHQHPGSLHLGLSPARRRFTAEAIPLTPSMGLGMMAPYPWIAPTLPLLGEVIDLESHLKLCGEILFEHGFMSTCDTIVVNCYHRATSAVLLSMQGHKQVHEFATDLVRATAPWTIFTEEILDAFCSRSYLKSELDKRVLLLKCSRPYAIFMSDCRKLFALNQRIFSDSSRTRDLVDSIIRKLPREIYTKLITRMRAKDSVDWQLAYPFASAKTKDVTFLSIMKELFENADSIAEVEAAIRINPQPPFKEKEALRVVGDGTTRPQLDDWVPKFAKVIYCRGPTHCSELAAVKQKLGDKAEVLYFPKGKSGPWGLLGLKAGTPAARKAEGQHLANLPLPSPPTTPEAGTSPVTQHEHDTDFIHPATLQHTTVSVYSPFSDPLGPHFSSDAVDAPKTRDIAGSQRVCFASIPRHHQLESELLVPVSIDEGQLKIQCLVDTGAGLDYLCVPSHIRSSMNIVQCPPFPVSMADNSVATISEKVITEVQMRTVAGQMTTPVVLHLFLFPHTDDEPLMLLGRSGIRAFDLCIKAGLVSLPDGAKVVDHTGDRACFVKAPTTVPTPESMLESCVERGWRPVPHAGEYECRLRRLEPNEHRDTPEQNYAFEIAMPCPSWTPEAPGPPNASTVRATESAARGHYMRTTAEQRAISDALVQEYVDLKFWNESTANELLELSSHLPTPVFLIESESRKPRIVCDFRAVNATIPKAGNGTTMPSQLIAALRINRPTTVMVTDATKAFYKLRLSDHFGEGNDKIWLVVASTDPKGNVRVGHFWSNRLCFGLAVGPAALVASMTALCEFPVFTGFLRWYIDDLVLGGTPTAVANDFSIVGRLLKLVGHSLQPAKSALICHPAVRDQVTALSLQLERGIDESAKVFGAQLQFSEDGLQLMCNNIDKAHNLTRLAQVQILMNTVKFTKKDFFSIGGILSYDLSKHHTEARVLADCLRSLIGREFAADSWQKPLSLASLSPKKSEALAMMGEWADELQGEIQTCGHSTCVPANCVLPIPTEIEVYVDASTTGGSFAIYHNGTVLWKDAWRWKGSQIRWHINRQEATALLAACQVLSDIVECAGIISPRPSVKIFSDNRSAIAWANPCDVNLSGKIERRALLNLVDALSDEQRVIRKYASVSIAHIAGAKNVEADRLSRLTSRVGPSDISLSELLECEKKKKKKVQFEKVDTVFPPLPFTEFAIEDSLDEEGGWDSPTANLLAESQMDPDKKVRCLLVNDALRLRPRQETPTTVRWVEQIAADTRDIGEIYRIAAVMRFCLRAWRSDRAGGTPSPFPDHFTEEDRMATARSAQANMSEGEQGDPLLHYEAPRDVYYYKQPMPTGQFRYQLYVPASAEWFQQRLIEEAHRAARHMGVDYTMATVTNWVLQRGTKKARSVIGHCVHCQVKRAGRLRVQHDVTMVTNISETSPFSLLALDHFTVGVKTVSLSVMCLCTGFVHLAYCKDHSTEATWTAFKSILHRMPRLPCALFSDKAPVFIALADKFQHEYKTPIEHNHTAGYIPSENGKIERMHQTALSVLRTSVHLEKLDVGELEPHCLQMLLDSVTCVLNRRPIGQVFIALPSESRFVVTPNVLVYGAGIHDDVMEESSERGPVVLPQVRRNFLHWRNWFQEYFWRLLKTESCKAQGKKKTVDVVFAIGELVLVYHPSTCKSGLDFKIARVEDIINNRLSVMGQGKRRVVHMSNCVKLRIRAEFPQRATDVSRVGANVSVTMDGQVWPGIVTEEESSGLLRIRWNLTSDGTGYPDEMLRASALTFR